MDKSNIKERILGEALYIVENQATVRETAIKFEVTKSTVYRDVTDSLLQYDFILYSEVQKVLKKNKAERSIRGGETTKKRYSKKRK